MARFSRMAVLNTIYEVGLLPIFYHSDLQTAKNVALAVSRAGAGLLEFVNRGDQAFEVFSALEKYLHESGNDLILGAGSILDPYSAALFINAGASFIVGPTLNAEVARLCNRRKIPYFPGCGSVSEISQAEELGCEICKIFPGEEMGGPKFISSVRGPMPWASLMPTGGVEPTAQSILEWIHAGAVALGMGSKLITPELVKNQNWKEIEDRIRATLALIEAAKKSKQAK